jgi:hypothetical protein
MHDTYRGVVKGNVIVLVEEVDLPDGTPVEVRIASPKSDVAETSRQLDELEKALRDAGLVLDFKRPPYPAWPADRAPIEVKGKPLSELIIEERR